MKNSSKLSSFTIFYIFAAIAFLLINNSDGHKIPKIPAVFAFGDSIVDPGNNNYLKTIIKCNFPPYGRDFQGGIPSGRFCNGKVPSDFIAKLLGVKDLMPPYLDQSLKMDDLLTGVSFASGGSGYDPLTPQLVNVLSLSDQLNLLREYTAKITAAVGEERAANIVSKSIHIVCVGSDDIANTYFSTPFRRPHFDINSYTDLMVSSASMFYQELYGLGARRIAVLSLPPIGCVPSQRTLNGGIQRECSEAGNQAAILFNSKIASLIHSLDQQLSDAKIVYFDIYYPLLSLIQNPARYGFEVATKGCCGTGNIEVSILCNSLDDSKSCKDASKYIFWDSYHPSEKAYEILSPIVLYNDVDNLF